MTAASNVCVALLLTAVIGCTSAGEPTQPAPAPPAEVPQAPEGMLPVPGDLDCAEPARRLMRTGTTRQALRAAYGEPDDVIATTEPNRHVPGAVDSLFTVRYPGLAVGLRKPTGAASLTYSIEVSDNRYLAYPAIGIGATAERVVQALGKPSVGQPTHLTYECGEVVNEPVTFELDDGRVTRIRILPYVD